MSKPSKQDRRSAQPGAGAPVPAPGGKAEEVELRVEELEERIAPRLASNHNESFVADR